MPICIYQEFEVNNEDVPLRKASLTRKSEDEELEELLWDYSYSYERTKDYSCVKDTVYIRHQMSLGVSAEGTLGVAN